MPTPKEVIPKKPSLKAAPSQKEEDWGDLETSIDESYKSKDLYKSGVLDPDKISGIKQYKIGDGDHLLDFLPWFCGQHHPNKKLIPGQKTYTAIYFIHKNIGPTGDWVLCPATTYGKPCPVCEYRREAGKDPNIDDDVVKALRTYRRTLYAVLDQNNQSAGWQLLDVAYFFMEEKLVVLSKDIRTGKYIPFPHPSKELGKSVAFNIKISGQNQQWSGHRFVDRLEAVPDSLWKSIPPLDELLLIPTYDDLQSLFYGGVSSAKPQSQMKDDFPERPIKVATATMTCPFGGTFGEDNNKYNECENCEIWDACAAAATESA